MFVLTQVQLLLLLALILHQWPLLALLSESDSFDWLLDDQHIVLINLLYHQAVL
jgi:hypothetical protein